MSVPFERIGPGQQGRLVYQVIGEDGPIFNPNRIRYLSPQETPNGAVPDLGVGLAGLDALASFGALSLSAATLASVQRLHEKADQILVGVTSIEKRTEQILEKVNRIDLKVAESSLREALKAIFRRAFSDEEIDLNRIKQLRGDIDSFLGSVDGGAMFNIGLRLSSDVKEMIHTLWSILAQTRRFVARAYNMSNGGDPSTVATFHPINDYLRVTNVAPHAVAITSVVECFDSLTPRLNELLNIQFTFFNDEDAEMVSSFMDEQGVSPIIGAFQTFSPSAFLLAAADIEAATQIPIEERHAYFVDLAEAWLTRTDAGLLYRTLVEIRGLEVGYVKEFWPHLEGVDLALGSSLTGVWDEAELARLKPRAAAPEEVVPPARDESSKGGMKARIRR